MVYPAFDQAIVHRPIIHLIKDFLAICNKYNNLLERAKFGLPAVGNELDLQSIILFSTDQDKNCEPIYSWSKSKPLAVNNIIHLKNPRKKIDDFFNARLIKEVNQNGFFTSKNRDYIHFTLDKFEESFITKLQRGDQVCGYIIFTFDYPVQFDQEIIDCLLSFVDILSMQSSKMPVSSISVSSSTLFDQTNNLIFLLNEHGEINFINRAYARLMKTDVSSYIGKDFRDAFDFVNKLGYFSLSSITSGQKLKNVCLELYCPNNEKKWFSFNFTPFHDDDTGLNLILVSASDISFQKKVEFTLRKRDLRSHLTSLATHDVCYDWDYKSNLIWWNNNIHDHFGHLHSAEINNRDWWEKHIHPDDFTYIKHAFKSAFESKNLTCSLEYRFKLANGDYAYVNDTAFISYDNHSEVIRLTGSIKDISEQRLAELALRNSRDSLSKLANRLQDVREDERKSLARELHDEFAQLLTALKLDITYLDKHKSGNENAQIDNMRNIVDQMMDRVQTIARELRPTVLDDLGLIHAISWQLNNFYELTDCDVSFINSFEKIVFKEEAVTAIFRIFQEALSNVARHAEATEVFVTAKNIHSRFTLTIKDNGKGIKNKYIDNPNAIGLLGMKERAYVLNGDVVVRKNNEGGTTVTLLIPIKNCIASYKNKTRQSSTALPSKTEGDLIN